MTTVRPRFSSKQVCNIASPPCVSGLKSLYRMKPFFTCFGRSRSVSVRLIFFDTSFGSAPNDWIHPWSSLRKVVNALARGKYAEHSANRFSRPHVRVERCNRVGTAGKLQAGWPAAESTSVIISSVLQDEICQNQIEIIERIIRIRRQCAVAHD